MDGESQSVARAALERLALAAGPQPDAALAAALKLAQHLSHTFQVSHTFSPNNNEVSHTFPSNNNNNIISDGNNKDGNKDDNKDGAPRRLGDSLWPPFALALAHGRPPGLRDAALNAVQRLLAHRLLTGASVSHSSVEMSHTFVGEKGGDSHPKVGESPIPGDTLSHLSPPPLGRRFSISGILAPEPAPPLSFSQSPATVATISGVATNGTTNGAITSATTSTTSSSISEPQSPRLQQASPSPSPSSAATPSTSAVTPSANQTTPLPYSSPLVRKTRLIDDIVAAVVGALGPAHLPSTPAEDALQVQVLKVLLTALTASNCEIHERSLALALQACFAIHAAAPKNSTNEVTAKASLTQIVNLVFSRMERFADALAKAKESGLPLPARLHRSPLGPSLLTHSTSNSVVTGGVANVDVAGDAASAASDAHPITKVYGVSPSSLNPQSAASEYVSAAESGSGTNLPPLDHPSSSSSVSSLQQHDPHPIRDDTESNDSANQSSPDDHAVQTPTITQTDDRELPVEPLEAGADISIANASGPNSARPSASDASLPPLPPSGTRTLPTSKPSPTNIAATSNNINNDDDDDAEDNPYNPSVTFYNNLLRRDVYITLRLLCLMSMHSDTPGAQTTNASSLTSLPPAGGASATLDELSPAAAKTRILAMELLLSVMNNAGTVLTTDPTFMHVVRTSLCPSLSRNAVTTHPALFELSLSIFLLVLRHYREHLKVEIEILLSTVYLQILELGNASYKHKSNVLQALIKICENPQLLVDLYVNYDCDLATSSVFERILNICTKLTQGRSDASGKSSSSSSTFGFAGFGVGLDSKAELAREQDRRLKLRGLCVLVAAIQSLAAWSAYDMATIVTAKTDTGSAVISTHSGVVAAARGMVTAAVDTLDRTDSQGTFETLTNDTAPHNRIDVGLASASSSNTSPQHANTIDTTPMTDPSKPLMDALALTSQYNPLVVSKNPLYMVSLDAGDGVGHASGSALAAVHGSVASYSGGYASVSSGHPNGENGGSTVADVAVTDASHSSISMLAPGNGGDGVSTTGSVLVANNGARTDPQDIEQAASRKQLFRRAIRLFNQKPVKGASFLIETGFALEDPQSLAEFLHSTSELSKAAVGEYLGEGNAFNIKVMHAFVDAVDFSGMGFVTALRYFLQLFRLPGEAQKIDRLMEKFADRYCEGNPDVFAKADTAYTLAFSVIMLNTDQHSSQIKHRMDKPAFIKNNRGINDDGDLPDDYLAAIFDEIVSNEIVMEEEQASHDSVLGRRIVQMSMGWGAGGLNDRQRMDLYRREASVIQKKSVMLMKAAGSANRVVAPYRTAVGRELARPMFAMSSWALMAALSLLFESVADEGGGTGEVDFTSKLSVTVGGDGSGYPGASSGGGGGNANSGSITSGTSTPSGSSSHGAITEPKITDLCLRGFAASIRLACIFKMETERDAFVSSLAKLTSLGNIYNIKPKNVKAIRTLVDLAVGLGELMEGSWLQIMKTVSQLERVQVIVSQGSGIGNGGGGGSSGDLSHTTEVSGSMVSGGRPGDLRRNSNSERSGSVTGGGSSVGTGGMVIASSGSHNRLDQTLRKISPVLENLVLELQSQTSLLAIDRLFTKSVNLSTTAILHFFRAVCQVSLEEVGLDAKGAPVMSATPGPPRMYLLQKIVEIAYYNMHRIRFEWTQIWRILQPHFNVVACHPSAHVSTFAVDALRQLGMKFLEREELGHFSAQHEFLRSFEWIIKHNTSMAIRELILGSMSQMITARARSIRSGWKSIFVVFARAAQADVRGMAHTAFAILQMVFRSYFDEVVSTGGFVDLVACLAEFALLRGQGPAHDELVMGSIQLLQSCTKSLIERAKDEAASVAASASAGDGSGKSKSKRGHGIPHSQSVVIPTLSTSSSSDALTPNSTTPTGPTGVNANAASTHHPSYHPHHAPRINNLPQQPYLQPNGCVSEEHFYLSWFPILSAFSRVIIESDGVLVRTHTLETLFETFRSSGVLFDSMYWRTIDRNIVSPIFDELDEGGGGHGGGGHGRGDGSDAMNNHAGPDGGGQRGGMSVSVGSEANSAVLILGLRLLVEMMTMHFDMLLLGVPVSNNTTSSSTGAVSVMPQLPPPPTPGRELMQHALDRMLAMMSRKDDKLAATGQICLQQFLLNNVHRMARYGSWTWVVDKIDAAFRVTLPAELINCEVGASGATANIANNNNNSSGGRHDGSVSMHRPIPRSRIVPLTDILSHARSSAREIGPAITLDDLDFERTIIKCVTHLDLLQTIREFCLTDVSGDVNDASSTTTTSTTSTTSRRFAIGVMPSPDRSRLLRCLHTSYAVARSFNSLTDLRHAIWRRGWVSQLPNLVKQETVAFSAYIVLMFGAYKTIGDVVDQGVGETNTMTEGNDTVTTSSDSVVVFDPVAPSGRVVDALVAQTMDLLDRFVGLLIDAQKHQRDIALWAPVVVVVYKELLTMDGWWVSGQSAGLPPLPHTIMATSTLSSSSSSSSVTPMGGRAAAEGSSSSSSSSTHPGTPASTTTMSFIPVSNAPPDPSRPTSALRRHLPRYFRLAIRILSVDRVDLRAVLQEFLEHVGDEFVRVDE